MLGTTPSPRKQQRQQALIDLMNKPIIPDSLVFCCACLYLAFIVGVLGIGAIYLTIRLVPPPAQTAVAETEIDVLFNARSSQKVCVAFQGRSKGSVKLTRDYREDLVEFIRRRFFESLCGTGLFSIYGWYTTMALLTRSRASENAATLEVGQASSPWAEAAKRSGFSFPQMPQWADSRWEIFLHSWCCNMIAAFANSPGLAVHAPGWRAGSVPPSSRSGLPGSQAHSPLQPRTVPGEATPARRSPSVQRGGAPLLVLRSFSTPCCGCYCACVVVDGLVSVASRPFLDALIVVLALEVGFDGLVSIASRRSLEALFVFRALEVDVEFERCICSVLLVELPHVSGIYPAAL
ncbi:hypothetical protein ISCGN_022006 [Ixodes scapularis]